MLARDIAGRDLLELDEVRAAQRGVLVDALEMRLVPGANGRELGGPARAARAVPSPPARR